MYIAPAVISCSDIINPDQLEPVTRQGFITSVIYIFDSFTRLNGFVLNTLCFKETDSSAYLVNTMLWHFLRSNTWENETSSIPIVNRDVSPKKKEHPSQSLSPRIKKTKKYFLLSRGIYLKLHMSCNTLKLFCSRSISNH